MRFRTLWLVSIATLLVSARAAANANCPSTPRPASDTGDDNPYFNFTWTEALTMENDFNIDRDDFSYAQGNFGDDNSKYQRLLNAIKLLKRYSYGNQPAPYWYDRAADTINDFNSLTRQDHCASGGHYDPLTGNIYLSDSTLYDSNVIDRAALLMHETRHDELGHNSDKCGVQFYSDDEASEQCDSSWGYNGAFAEGINFIVSASQEPGLFSPDVLEESRGTANWWLGQGFESDPGFRLRGEHNGVVGNFTRRYWDCTAAGGYDCPSGGAWEWTASVNGSTYPGQVEAGYIHDPDEARSMAITGVGVGMRERDGSIGDDITVIKLKYRRFQAFGTLGPEHTVLVGRNPQESAVQLWIHPDEANGFSGTSRRLVTGVVVRASDSGITSLGARYRKWDSSSGYFTSAGESTVWANANQVETETNVRVAPYHVLSGLGLRSIDKNVSNAAYNQTLPLFTQRAGGQGGGEHLVRCPTGDVAVGVAVNRSTTAPNEVRFFALLCASEASVTANATSIDTLVYGSYWDAGAGLEKPAGASAYAGFSFPPGTTVVKCFTGDALNGVRVHSGAVVDRIDSITCGSLADFDDDGVYARSVGVGGPGGSYDALDCRDISQKATVDGMYVRTGYSLDQIGLHCRDLFSP